MDQTSPPPRKLKPLLPVKYSLNNLSNYHIFKKSHYKILKKVKIATSPPDGPNSKSLHFQGISVLKKVFQTLKYVKKLDLTKLTLVPSSLYKPKIISFAKRMQRISKISFSNKFLPNKASHGASVSWPKHAKRLTSCNYHLSLCLQNYCGSSKPIKPLLIFPYLFTHQPHLQDLTLHFNFNPASLFPDSHLFYRYPSTLQRLSLHDINIKKPINASLSHLYNLKELELLFHYQIQIEPLISVLQLLPQLSSTLQGFSLQWPDRLTPDLTPVFPAFRALKNLTRLRLMPQNRGIKRFSTILEAFEDCPLKELVIKASIKSETDFILIANFVKRMENLEAFELRGRYNSHFINDTSGIKKVLEAVDGLSHLKRFSFITDSAGKKDCIIELGSVLAKMLTKAVPLETFVLSIKPLRNIKENLLRLVEALQPIAGNLKEFWVYMGEELLAEAEFEMLLGFIESLKSLKVLRLSGLSLTTKQSFMEFTKVILRMPYLKVLMVGEVRGEMAKSVFMSVIKEILQKRGLKIFDCRASPELLGILTKKEKGCDGINVVEILKRNPSLKRLPQSLLPIFNGKEILTAGGSTWQRAGLNVMLDTGFESKKDVFEKLSIEI